MVDPQRKLYNLLCQSIRLFDILYKTEYLIQWSGWKHYSVHKLVNRSTAIFDVDMHQD